MTPLAPPAAVERGHTLDWDPPAAPTAAKRWTCSQCGHAVLDYCGVVYGSALDNDCTEEGS